MNIKNLFKKKPIDLEKIFNEHKFEFELLLLKDFTGYIPKDVQEPVLKMFKEYGEDFERWTLFQSWYVNSRAINDPLKITFYNGMMLYLKTLNTMARVYKKNSQTSRPQIKQEEVVATNFLEDALQGIKEFKNGNKITENNQTNNDESSTETTKV